MTREQTTEDSLATGTSLNKDEKREKKERLKKKGTGITCNVDYFELNDLPTKVPPALILHLGALNRGTAFTYEQRNNLRLRALLPPKMETIEQQMDRTMQRLNWIHEPLQKYSFLMDLCNHNITLFYRILITHMKELLPIVYTPTVGEACQKYSELWQFPNGLFFSLNDKGHVKKILGQWVYPRIDIIVVTDGSRVLGLGDLGCNGMGIPVGKLMVYVIAGGLHPCRTLPVMIDMGTNNKELRESPHYLGINRPRAAETPFFKLMDEFMAAIHERWPYCIVQFEDFSRERCFTMLDRYRSKYPCFDDDVQGTGAVVLAGLINACKLLEKSLVSQNILILGSGTAAIGVADIVINFLQENKIELDKARRHIFLVDSKGLVTLQRGSDLPEYKFVYARDDAPQEECSFLDAVKIFKPTILIGLSGKSQAFNEEVIREMKKNSDTPIIFALSNPLENSECIFEQAINWTDGNLIFASGSPMDDVNYRGQLLVNNQCNNMYIFPGLGLGCSFCKARRITDGMLLEASKMLAACRNLDQFESSRAIYPPLEQMRDTSEKIAIAVVRQAFEENVASIPQIEPLLEKSIREYIYYPDYPK